MQNRKEKCMENISPGKSKYFTTVLPLRPIRIKTAQEVIRLSPLISRTESPVGTAAFIATRVNRFQPSHHIWITRFSKILCELTCFSPEFFILHFPK
jgi:hypothetical protein